MFTVPGRLVTRVTAQGFATCRNTRVMFSMSPEREERTPRIEPRWLVPKGGHPSNDVQRASCALNSTEGRAPGPHEVPERVVECGRKAR
jgi:hypothetical protein